MSEMFKRIIFSGPTNRFFKSRRLTARLSHANHANAASNPLVSRGRSVRANRYLKLI